MDGSIIIKRYSNRKLYDTDSKRFVTLDDIAKILNSGKSIKVLEKSTGEDVTAHVTASLLRKHYDLDGKLLNIPDESPLELIKNKLKIIRVKRSLDVMYRLVRLRASDRKTLDSIVDSLLEEGFITEEMALEAEETLWQLLKERDVEIEKKLLGRIEDGDGLLAELERLRGENERLREEIEKLKKENR